MRVSISLALVAFTPSIAGAQQWDSATSRVVVPGVVHRRLVVNSGPWRMNVLEIDLRTRGLSFEGVRSNDRFHGRETVRSMVERYRGPGSAVAAVNGDFFNVRTGTGESENNVVIGGEIWKGVRITDSPYDTWDNLHSQFGVDGDNKPFIDRFGIQASVMLPGAKPIRLDGINFRQDTNSLVLYTPAIGDSTPVDSVTTPMLWVPLRLISRQGGTMRFRVVGKPRDGRSAMLAGGYALAGSGNARERIAGIARRGGNIRVVSRLYPHRGNLRTIVGGWPRLILHGRSVAEYADIVEGTFPRFSAGRHPRTAIGFSKDSSTLILFTVDGRRESDAGMSLVEVARAMLALGAYEAMAFDGGGSTTMVVEGKVVNRPSDQAGERPVGSGLLVVIDPSPARQ